MNLSKMQIQISRMLTRLMTCCSYLWKAAWVAHDAFSVHCQHCIAMKQDEALRLGTSFFSKINFENTKRDPCLIH